MLTTVAPPNRLGFVSGLGGAIGQGASVVLALFVLLCITLPGRSDWALLSHPLFGLDQTMFEDIRIVGPLTALVLAVGVVMLMLFSPDTPKTGVPLSQAIRGGFGEVRRTIAHLKSYPDVRRLLVARMFVNDAAVGALQFSGIYAAGVFGWGPGELA